MMLLIIFGLTSLLLIGMGIYIRKKNAIWLLSNFSEDRVRDKAGMARWASLFLYLFAGIFFIFGYGIFKYQGTAYEIVPVFVLIPCILLLTVLYLTGGQRFLNKGYKKHNNNGRINL